jgi:hypothetical protein
VTAPGVRCAQQGFAHALSGSVLHHARGHYVNPGLRAAARCRTWWPRRATSCGTACSR